MDSLLLSRITKDFLNVDPDVVPENRRYRMGWSGSVMASHGESRVGELIEMREGLRALFGKNDAPKLPKPMEKGQGSLRPAWYFFRGAEDRKTPEPIPYLMTETNESAKARPVPGSSQLLRSICKGKGVLKQNQHGFVYLDIDNRFISMLLPYLKGQGLVRPPYFNLLGEPEGAHIPVIPAREVAFQYLGRVEEVGREYSFEIEGLYSMEPVSWPEVEQVWFFKVRSEEMENLRRSLFLPALPGGHAFHIAVAVKPRVTSRAIKQPLPLMQINRAFIAA